MKEGTTIIDNYRELPLGDWQDILAINKDETLDELTRQVKTISILTGMDEDTLLNIPIQEYTELASRTTFLEDGLPETNARLASSYRIGRFELIPVTDIRKVNTAQYIDFQTFHQAGMEEHFAEILSCLLVPKGKKYNQDYDVIEVQDAIRSNLSVFDAVTLYGFFIVSCSESMKDILTFSMQEVKKDKRLTRKEKDGILARIQKQLTLLTNAGAGSQM